jgi:hypothetical protein
LPAVPVNLEREKRLEKPEGAFAIPQRVGHAIVARDYAVILSPWLGGWLVTRIRADLALRLIA